MKQGTKVWAKCESMGRPNETLVINDSVYQCVMKFADWMQNTYMGSYMRFTIARTQQELEDATRKWARKEKESGEPDQDMMHDLITLLGQKEFQLESPEADRPEQVSGNNPRTAMFDSIESS